MTCEFCAALTGRFNAARECCQLRLLAGAPAHSRREVYERVRRDDGAAALDQLKQKVRAEYQRQQDYRTAIAREQHDRETAKGRAESAALLKKMKELNMNTPATDRTGAASAAPMRELA